MHSILNGSIPIYEKLFGIEFPFKKYDTVFCPEYNYGAMENPGCITFTEKYLFKNEVSRVRRNFRANTITHELAHMWFGNLVTMNWWDDLWLNESFADFISHLCLSKLKLKDNDILDNPWISFNHSK